MSEKNEQMALIAWANLEAARTPELALLFAIPNQGPGRRNRGYLHSLIRQGLKPGVPDLFLPVARGRHHGMFLEMKYGRGTVSANQECWLKWLGEQDYHTAVCWTYEEARDAILSYLGIQLCCGHPVSAIVSSDEGTNWCKMCEEETND